MASLKKKRALVDKLVKRWQTANPDPKCELYHKSNFQLLVSVVLSAQTTDKMVNRCMEPIYKKGFTPETVLRWGQEKLLEKIRTIGLANTKAKNVFRLSEIISEQYKGKIPSTREELEKLPGVGRKTANVILGEVFKHPTLAVDTHVYRVGKRLGLHNEKTPEKAEKVLLEAIDAKYLPEAHHWLILHGRYICKARNPACDDCPVADLCPQHF
ncbi:MAG: endonuclease III [Bdellovibrionota bacterium]